ncbi:MAG: NAD-dependent epimerase/dehydratase family protein [Myxococcales bacterium]|nr:NAD-dependent epimerase/dehydratase family protein [Myxococcales bacterium]
MRILVTGGAGFIGSHIADALLGDGHEVAVVDDLSSGRRENVPGGATFFEGDIRDGAFVDRVFDEFGPQQVSHQAAQTSVSVSTREPGRDAEINVLGTINLLDASARTKLERFVFASTGGAIYGEVADGERARVGWPPRPLSPYACSKLAAEHYLEAYNYERGLDYRVVRYANVYGPRQDPHGEAGVVAIFSQRLLAGESLQINARKEVGDEGCVRDYVYVADCVRANLLALGGKLGEPIVNVCTGEGCTTQALALKLAEAIGMEPELRHADRRAGDVERSVLDGGDFLGAHPPTPLATGLAETVEWFRQRG